MNVVGIMSGTSLDAMDFVLCAASSASAVKFRDMATVNFSRELRERLVLAAEGEMKVADLNRLHFDLGRAYAAGLVAVAKKKKWKIDLIGLHGQTIFHEPRTCTWQIGSPAFLRDEFAVPVISDFRSADVAEGGEGAPLAPIFHFYALGALARKHAIAVHNLGGISNVTFLKKGVTRLRDVSAFDTGPANILMNIAMEKITGGEKSMDENGALAARGVAHAELVAEWLKHPYFKEKPPKSTGRELFGEAFAENCIKQMRSAGVKTPEHQMATLLEFTAQSIADSYKRFAPKDLQTVYLCGGGSRNTTLVKRLRYLLAPFEIATTDAAGWPTQAVEGGAFALLAYLRTKNTAFELHHITGSRGARPLGVIS